MSNLPSGTVTFLFTDIEGSATLAQRYPGAWSSALARHDAILRAAATHHGGRVIKVIGDAFQVAFTAAPDAVAAATEAQRALHLEPWGETGPIRVRMGLHTGAAEVRDADDGDTGPGDGVQPDYDAYLTLTRVQRVMSAAHGEQVLLTQATAELVRDNLSPDAVLRDLGEHRLKSLVRPEHVFQLTVPGLPSDFPPLNTLGSRPNNLPRQLTRFIGRETELTSLKDLLSDVHNRLVTIVAPGGMGKTRLALEAAGQIYEEGALGVCFVALDRLNSADLIVQAVAEG